MTVREYGAKKKERLYGILQQTPSVLSLAVILFVALSTQASAQKAIELTPTQRELLKQFEEEALNGIVRAQDRLVRAQVALRCLGYYFGSVPAKSEKQVQTAIGAFMLWQREAGFLRLNDKPDEERLTLLEAQAHRKTKGKCEIKD